MRPLVVYYTESNINPSKPINYYGNIHTKLCSWFTNSYQQRGNIPSSFSINSEANASGLLENIEDL